MSQQYVDPELQVIEFAWEDVVRTSGDLGDNTDQFSLQGDLANPGNLN